MSYHTKVKAISQTDPHFSLLRLGFIFAALLSSMLVLMRPASANTLTVTNINDSGAGSLRQAILSANSGDTINFDSSLSDSTIVLTSGELVVDKVLTLASAIPITVSGNESSRVISASASLTLTGFTITSGLGDSHGGGVYAGDRLVVQQMNFSNNGTQGFSSSDGGAISANSDLIVDQSLFQENYAGRSGGAIHAGAAFTITRSGFFDNQSTFGFGGAIDHSSSDRQSPIDSDGAIINSVFVRNRQQSIGLALMNELQSAGDNVDVVNGFSPVYVFNLASNGQVQIIHNTIVGEEFTGQQPQSIAIFVSGGTAMISNTIIMSYTEGINYFVGTVIEDFNLFNSVNQPLNPLPVNMGANDRTDTTGNNHPAFMDSTTDNYRLQATSDAIDNGTNAGVFDDHDGILRDAAPDIGAFESPFGAAELNIADASVTEGNSGTTLLSLPVTLSTVKGITVTVAYTISEGSATNGEDYTGTTTGVLSFAPGVTDQNIDVSVSGETLVEANETLNVLLGNPQFASINDGSAVGTITNDDSASFTIQDASVLEGDSGTTALVFAVTLNNPVDNSLLVSYASSNGTATTSDSDYDAASGDILFEIGETSKSITVTVNGDTRIEADETLTMTLNGEFPYALGFGSNGGIATGTIVNDDSPTPTPTTTATASATPTNVPTPTATPTPNLHLKLTSNPVEGTQVASGATISYSLTMSNSGGIANNLAITVVVPNGVVLIPSSVVPPTSDAALISGVNDSKPQAETILIWKVSSLDTNQRFDANFAVTVNETIPVIVQAQGGEIGSPPTVVTLTHPVAPTDLEENEEPPTSTRLFLPFVTSSQ